MKKFLLLAAGLYAFSAGAQQKIDVEAHRGGRALMPENTIPTMLHAIDLGVRTLELDCVISADKKVVVSHDVYMSSDFMRKPDGSDLTKAEEKEYRIYAMTYDSVRKFDAGMKPHPEFPEQVKMKTYKPLLSELIDSVEAYVKKHHLKPVYYNMEVKSSPMGDDKYHPKPEEFVSLMMNVIKEKKIADRVIIQSFDVRSLQVVHRDNPKQVTSLLVFNKGSLDSNVTVLGFKPDIYSPYYTAVTPEMVKAAHAQHIKVLPWTPNESSDMQKLIDAGVDGIITDYPDRLVQLAGSYQKKK
jgi:glycerophosphoryl diester phosphodiesterase